MIDDRMKQIIQEIKDSGMKEELDKKYYNLMGPMIYKQPFLDALNNRDNSKYFYFVMMLNVMDTH